MSTRTDTRETGDPRQPRTALDIEVFVGMDRIHATVLTDSLEIWEVTNAQNATHNFHFHDMQFQVLTVDGRPPPPELAGWKDTISLPPDVRFSLILRFADYAGPDMPYIVVAGASSSAQLAALAAFTPNDPQYQPGSRMPTRRSARWSPCMATTTGSTRPACGPPPAGRGTGGCRPSCHVKPHGTARPSGTRRWHMSATPRPWS
jgi:hypothetical protein